MADAEYEKAKGELEAATRELQTANIRLKDAEAAYWKAVNRFEELHVRKRIAEDLAAEGQREGT